MASKVQEIRRTARENIKEVVRKYIAYVQNNPGKLGQTETSVRIVSYLISGRFSGADVIAELIYSASNLLILLNDSILLKAAKEKPNVEIPYKKLLRWLTVLDYVEVFLEVASGRLGSQTRWIVILCLQIAKAALRFIILVKHKTGLLSSPAMPPLKRDQFVPVEPDTDPTSVDNDAILNGTKGGPIEMTFTLKRSGRVIRTLQAAPNINQRSWKLPGSSPAPKKDQNKQYPPTLLNGKQMIAEGLHISRPIVHLISMYLFGQLSWKPLIAACGMDVSSLYLLGEPNRFNLTEKAELRRRTLLLLFYLLRSPFYDRYSQAKILWFLRSIADNIPGTGLLIKPLLDYLPFWQKVYFYVWSV